MKKGSIKEKNRTSQKYQFLALFLQNRNRIHLGVRILRMYRNTILALTIWNKLRSLFSSSAAGGASAGIERTPKQRHRTTKRHIRLKESVDSGNPQAETVITARGMAAVDTGRRTNAEVKMRSPPPATPSPQPPIPLIHVCGEVDQLHIKDCFRVSENKMVGLTFYSGI
ncbi:hypothetical protein DdX_08352 [Ditylenchus destructor]|uniref:Uncharacterized protein n=1 Tax=Ditylenchus destructor TaxID=166010 RepID=A0AAD4R4E7_9BILA|nr:hypothetical protein DdX_08352 [Ditylenchus destructor]